MTHVLTVSMMKGSSKGNCLAEPKLNTKTREVWDKLQNNKGLIVELASFGIKKSILKGVLDRFRNSWGLDIRVFRRRRLPALYCLAGEWEGLAYIDYIAERHANTNSL